MPFETNEKHSPPFEEGYPKAAIRQDPRNLGDNLGPWGLDASKVNAATTPLVAW
jgi:hypothetical protein